jgi:prepilin-type N-terminal cleavage/methylation domain-containing protein
MEKLFKKNNKQEGYTLIETMIAISIFLIVVTIGMDSLLNATLVHNKSQNLRSIMDNLSFTMEDMSRNLRTGYDYHCIDTSNDNNPNDTSLHSCAFGEGISFTSSLGGQWVYYIRPDVNNNNKIVIQKSVSGGSGPFVTLNDSEITINQAESGFTVVGAESFSSGDTQQPFVTIRLVGTINTNNVVTPFSLQTSVSQRLIDI